MTGPVTDPESKTVMLRAERGDELIIDTEAPIERVSVARRTDTYFGPKLILYSEPREENWMLTAPGPESQLMLWQPVLAEDNMREGWEKYGEVTVKLVDVKQYNICEMCGEPLSTVEHQRMAFLGIEHSVP